MEDNAEIEVDALDLVQLESCRGDMKLWREGFWQRVGYDGDQETHSV